MKELRKKIQKKNPKKEEEELADCAFLLEIT